MERANCFARVRNRKPEYVVRSIATQRLRGGVASLPEAELVTDSAHLHKSLHLKILLYCLPRNDSGLPSRIGYRTLMKKDHMDAVFFRHV